MKTTIRNGAVVKCDMVTVSEDGTVHRAQCGEKFISYSMSGIVREQAVSAGWARTRVGLVRWPGQPPMADAKKVDICPEHAALVITTEEAKAMRKKKLDDAKARRAAERAEAKAEKKRQRDEAREVAKAVKQQNKPKRKKKEKTGA